MKRDAGALGFSIFTWAQYLQKYYQKGGDSFQEIHIQLKRVIAFKKSIYSLGTNFISI